MYTAAVLTPQSQQAILQAFRGVIPLEWKVICHHMTINMGNAQAGPAKDLLGQPVKMTITGVGQSDKVIAAKVETQTPSANALKHITLAVNIKGGGKPFMSNQITNWNACSPFEVDGVIEECQ